MSDKSKIAVVFPGQGSQSVGMLQELAAVYPSVKQTFSQASETLGFDLWELVQNGPQDRLNLTENAQPALLVSSVAIWRILHKELGVEASVMAGHSLGEWSALVCAGTLTFEDAVRLVRLRGKYMQEAVAVGVGSMAAIIGLADDAIQTCCDEAAQGEVVGAVNFNSPGQVVIAGHAAAVERACELCKSAGAKRALPLAVSAPFHTSLMKPAADRLAVDMAAVSFSTPDIPIIHNVHAAQESTSAGLRQIMVEQISAPVKWVDCVEKVVSMGTTNLIECGPGKVLCGLTKRIDKSVATWHSDSSEALEQIKRQLLGDQS